MSQPPGPPGPYQQYPGQGQPPGGFGPQQGQPSGGFPAQGPPPGQGYGPPQGPPPGQYPPSGGFQQPGFDPYGGGQKKSPLPWILGGVGALVVIGGVILLIVLLGGGGGAGSTAEATGKAAAEAISNKDVDALKGMMCATDKQMAEQASESGPLKEVEQKNLSAEFISATESGNKGEAKLKVTEEGEGTEDVNLPLVKESDEWLVCFSSGMSIPGSEPVPGGDANPPAPGGDEPPPGMPSIPIPPPNYPTN